MSLPIVVALLVLGLSAAVSAVVVLQAGARLCGSSLLLFSAALIASVLIWNSSSGGGPALATFAWGVCLPVALLAYPSAVWSEPIGFVVWVTVLAGGGLATFGYRLTLVEPGVLVIGVALVAHFLWRYDRAGDVERVPLLWMAFAVGASGMIYGHIVFLVDQMSWSIASAAVAVAVLALGLVPPALVVGLVRPDIVDVRGLIVEAIVLEVAVLAYVAVFVGITSAAELAGVEDLNTGTLATVAAFAALGFHPLRGALRGVIDELLFGNRPDPLDAATKVADQIGDDPVLALAAVREAMVLPFASLIVGGEELAASGTPVAHTRRLTLALGDDTVGEVVVGLRPGDLRLSPADERVLRIVAPLLAQTLRARSLAADLRMSRGEAITAIEEERRRIRNDLHDGLGPTLSGIAFTADAARNSLGDSSAANDLLRTLRGEAASAIGEIRRLVYGLRPPALDELGLIGALKQWTRHVPTSDGRRLVVGIDAPDHLADLPAVVEVAAYRIVVEALTNAARHSSSERADVRLALVGDELTIEVRDHGNPPDSLWRPGVGLTSMRERAAAIGGTLIAQPTPEGGYVGAVLPIP